MALQGHCRLAESECYKDSKAADYRGTVSRTKSGLTCLSWNIQKKSDGRYGYWTGTSGAAAKGVSDHNYCRNPDGVPGAWCYTTSSKKRWELCNVGGSASPVPACGLSSDRAPHTDGCYRRAQH